MTLTAAVPDGRGASPSPVTDAGYRPRTAVRLLVADAATGTTTHRRFDALADVLRPGDVLVINVSATVPAAVEGVGTEGPVRVHLSSPVAGALWTAEPRRPLGVGAGPWRDFAGGRVEHRQAHQRFRAPASQAQSVTDRQGPPVALLRSDAHGRGTDAQGVAKPHVSHCLHKR